MSLDHPPYQPPGMTLSVSDVERLAKAGVAIRFEDIKYQIEPDTAAPPPQHFPMPRTLEEAFWDRWRRAHLPRENTFGAMIPYTINASEQGGKVYVFVSPGDQPPFILEDDAVLYPSDALMAKLALYEKSK